MADGAIAQGYTVLGQTELMRPDASGAYVRGTEVRFQLPSGSTGSVFVPESKLTVANVKAAIEAKVAVMSSVEQLGG